MPKEGSNWLWIFLQSFFHWQTFSLSRFSLSVPLLFILFIVPNKSQLYKDFLAMTFFSAEFSSFASSFMFLRGSADRVSKHSKVHDEFFMNRKNKPDWFFSSSHETWNPIIFFLRKQFHERTNWTLDKSLFREILENFAILFWQSQ